LTNKKYGGRVATNLRSRIRSVPDFPKEGIVFRDITTLLKDADSFREAVRTFVDHYRDQGIQKVVAIESRGFILGAVLAHQLRAGFVPVRKPGKLPWRTLHQEYLLEYGSDAVEIHEDALSPGERVLVHDDLLATGGTAAATSELVQRLGGTIAGFSFLIELAFLKGREKLKGYDVFSILRFDSEEE
jgi:adenine phosphoribosyltransferase